MRKAIAICLGLAAILCGSYWLLAIRPYLHIQNARLTAPSIEICADQMGRLFYAPHEEGALIPQGETLFSLCSMEEKIKALQMEKGIEDLEENLAMHLTGIEKAMQDYLSARVQFSESDFSAGPLAALQEHQDLAIECRQKISAGREKLSEQQLAIDQKSFRAPFSGVITKREKREGEVVQFGDRIYSFCDPSRTCVEAIIPEKDISKISLQQKAIVRLVADSSRLKGTVSWISPIALENGQGVLVRIALDPSQKTLSLPNFSADVDIRVR